MKSLRDTRPLLFRMRNRELGVSTSKRRHRCILPEPLRLKFWKTFQNRIRKAAKYSVRCRPALYFAGVSFTTGAKSELKVHTVLEVLYQT
jgi:hypothetical protein